ncbi:helix-turn-helix domain-containing protein [Bradyrhizobium paxllaeri]|uniref:helix-turn-helix domain-containing protein n=1 Tax=Bradyrhizobium paxllaeri TaxID=190148 RepID=UPI00081057FB|nr:helix-turn-helix domain-containing protein [Bradyrhizobium paxllaeri]
MDDLTVITSRVDGFEGFRNAVHGSHVDVMQLQRGRFRGLLTHIGAGDFSLSVGSFSVGLRTQRTSSDPKLIVGMLLGAENRVTHWSYDMDPGDVLVIPPGVDHDGRFHGAASYAALRLDLSDVAGVFGRENRMGDPTNWNRKDCYRADPRIGGRAIAKLREIVSRLADPNARISPKAVEFWRRTIIDVVTATVQHSQSSGMTEMIPSATRVTQRAEQYIETAGSRPVHISEICAECGVSRRSLHRAFDEVLGIGPVTFLQRKRLCDIHSALRDSDPATTTIAEIALQHGFLNLGRFSGYYRTLFDEYPSETFGKRYPGRSRRLAEPAATSNAALPASRSASLPRRDYARC